MCVRARAFLVQVFFGRGEAKGKINIIYLIDFFSWPNYCMVSFNEEKME